MNHFYFRTIGLFWIIFQYQGTFLSAQATMSDSIYTVVDSLPTFPGGVEKMTNFVKLSLSKEVEDYIEKGKAFGSFHLPVLISFVVEKDGALSMVEAAHSYPKPNLAEEAIRIVMKMPKWSPGKKDGQIVRTHITIPVSFYLDILKLAKKSNNNSNGVDTEDGGFLFGINYQKSFLYGKIGNHLEPKLGLTFDFALFGLDGANRGLGLYYTLLRTSVIEPFDRRQGIWDVGRNSSLNEIGFKSIYRINTNKRIEFFPTSQMGAIWHRRAKKYESDSGLGMGTVGFSIGLGLNLFWYIHQTDYFNHNIIQFSLLGQQVFMKTPLKGPIISLSIGYSFLWADY